MIRILVLQVFFVPSCNRRFHVSNYLIAFLIPIEFSLKVKEITLMLVVLVDLITHLIPKMIVFSLTYSRDLYKNH